MVNKSKNKIVNKVLRDKYNNNTFESIKHLDDYGNEYWYARELSKALEYSDWRKFLKVLNKAKVACKNSGFNVDEQLVEVNKLSKRNNNDNVNIQDYKLSRYIKAKIMLSLFTMKLAKRYEKLFKILEV